MKETPINRQSFVEGADDSLFSLDNLPYGVFYRGSDSVPHIGTAIGSYVLDLTVLEQHGYLSVQGEKSVFNQKSLNHFASLGSSVWSKVRQQLQYLLSVDVTTLQHEKGLLSEVLISQSEVTMLLPFHIQGFTDFYASEYHATNVGRLFRPHDAPLLPNWKHLPVGYNGRASTVFVSGTPIPWPSGLIKASPDSSPIFSASRKLDFEMELGFFVGTGNPDGQPINVAAASEHIFGCVLLNDWSARDIQAFEYQPLGPFLAKSFGTSISPWVVPYEALAPAMKPLPQQLPRPADYLYQETSRQPDILCRVEIQPAGSNVRTILCETRAPYLYWSMEQMLAHHTVNHCIMKPGDLLGTGTISGPLQTTWGSLLELSMNGQQPIQLKDGGERTFLQVGDSIIMTGFCNIAGRQIGFSSVEGTLLSP